MNEETAVDGRGSHRMVVALGVAVSMILVTSCGSSGDDDTSVGADAPAIVTVGGDRETFDFTDPENYLRVEDDVWTFAAPG